MPRPEPLQYGQYYHIYNRANGGEALFPEQRNYPYFLELYARYIEPVAETYAYCLLRNQFHFLARMRTPEEQEVYQKILEVSEIKVLDLSRQFSKLFNSYAKAINNMYDRTGSLFEHPFHRIEVDTDTHFGRLVTYIHQNPQKHGLADDFRDWPFSSYEAILSRRPTRVQRDGVVEWFGGLDGFVEFHTMMVSPQSVGGIVLGEEDL